MEAQRRVSLPRPEIALPRATGLEREMKQLLLQMLLVSEGTTANLNATGKGESENPLPVGGHDTLCDYWTARWAAEPTQETVGAAREALEGYLRGPEDRPEQQGDMDQWIVEDAEGLSVVDAARKFNTLPRHVRRARLAGGRESEFGLRLELVVEDRSERVLFLASRGCSVRQIELQTAVPRETVRRWLKEAA
jgi:hypothetical protein